MKAVYAVSGSVPNYTAKIVIWAICLYALIALGWAMIVVPAISKKKDRVLSGVQVGPLYVLVLYGIFNFTIGAMVVADNRTAHFVGYIMVGGLHCPVCTGGTPQSHLLNQNVCSEL